MVTHAGIDPRAVATEYVPETWQRIRAMNNDRNLRRLREEPTDLIAVHTKREPDDHFLRAKVTVHTPLLSVGAEHNKPALHAGSSQLLIAKSGLDETDGTIASATNTDPEVRSLTPLDPKSLQTKSGSEQEAPEQMMLAARIVELWSAQLRKASSVRKSLEDLLRLRGTLGAQLFEFKQLLARTGRNGGGCPSFAPTGFLALPQIGMSHGIRLRWSRSQSASLRHFLIPPKKR